MSILVIFRIVVLIRIYMGSDHPWKPWSKGPLTHVGGKSF